MPASAQAAVLFTFNTLQTLALAPGGHLNSPGLLLFVEGSVALGAQDQPLKVGTGMSQLEQRVQKGTVAGQNG